MCKGVKRTQESVANETMIGGFNGVKFFEWSMGQNGWPEESEELKGQCEYEFCEV